MPPKSDEHWRPSLPLDLYLPISVKCLILKIDATISRIAENIKDTVEDYFMCRFIGEQNFEHKLFFKRKTKSSIASAIYNCDKSTIDAISSYV